MVEVVKGVFGLLCLAAMLACAVLVMYLALHRSSDVLLNRLDEPKREWAGKWLARLALGLLLAGGLLLGAGALHLD